MSNSTVKRALRRRVNFYLKSPVFNKFSRSLKDFLTVTFLTIMTIFVCLSLLVAIIWFSDDEGMTGIGNCGTADCIDQ